jgi:hypothetical protein
VKRKYKSVALVKMSLLGRLEKDNAETQSALRRAEVGEGSEERRQGLNVRT